MIIKRIWIIATASTKENRYACTTRNGGQSVDMIWCICPGDVMIFGICQDLPSVLGHLLGIDWSLCLTYFPASFFWMVCFPLFPSLIFRRVSSDKVFPLFTTLIFRRVSSDLGFPFFASLIFRRVSSDLGLPLLASLIFLRVSSLRFFSFALQHLFFPLQPFFYGLLLPYLLIVSSFGIFYLRDVIPFCIC